jgi:hypothetical protein
MRMPEPRARCESIERRDKYSSTDSLPADGRLSVRESTPVPLMRAAGEGLTRERIWGRRPGLGRQGPTTGLPVWSGRLRRRVRMYSE